MARLALLVLVATVAYAQSLSAWFVGDDFEEIWSATNPGGGIGSFDHSQNHVRPLAKATLRITEWAVGLDPLAYHVTNLGLHVVAAALVGLLATSLARRLGPGEPGLAGSAGDAERLGLIASLVFVAMPNHTEAVSWISGRGDLLVVVGCLASALAWLRGGGSWRSPWSAGAVLALGAALAAKESAASFPLVLTVIHAGALATGAVRQRVVAALRSTGPFYGALAAYLAWRSVVLDDLGGSYASAGTLDWHPVRTPARLAVLVLRSVLPAGPLPLLVGGIAVGAAALVWWIRSPLSGRRTVAAIAGACLVVAAVPPAGLGVALRSIQGERLVYLPSAFAAIVIAVLVASVLGRLAAGAGAGRAAPIAATAVLVAAVAMTASIDHRWAEAGRLSRSIHRHPVWDRADVTVLLTDPETVAGAYAGRNAFGAAAVLVHGWPDPRPLIQLTTVRFTSRHDQVTVTPTGRPREWRIRLRAPGARFSAIYDGAANGVVGYPVRREGPQAVVVEIPPSVDLERVVYVSGGRLHHLGE